ncbi:MAG: hypothetical protein NZ730_13695 [Porticoccaceae bacterium]|nr:hypothetical protein [Porticoccaceae bacterium]
MLITLALSVSALFFALHKSSAATALLLLFIAWLAAGTGVSNAVHTTTTAHPKVL